MSAHAWNGASERRTLTWEAASDPVCTLQVLYNMAPRSFTQSCQAATVASIAASTVRPGDTVPSSKQPPAQVRPRQSRRLPPLLIPKG